MLNRFGFALIILLFGCLLFGIGYLWNGNSPLSDIDRMDHSQDATLEGTGKESSMASESQREENSEGIAPPNLANLFLGASSSAKHRYTLLLGQFTSQKLANSYAREIGQSDSDIILVTGDEGINWWLVTRGDYSLAEATRAAYDLKAVSDRDSAVIKLPAKPEE